MCPNNSRSIYFPQKLAPLSAFFVSKGVYLLLPPERGIGVCIKNRVAQTFTNAVRRQEWVGHRGRIEIKAPAPHTHRYTRTSYQASTFQRMEPFSSLPSSAASSSESCSSDSLTDFKTLVYDNDLLNLDLDQVSLLFVGCFIDLSFKR